jgi:hypothetical protein
VVSAAWVVRVIMPRARRRGFKVFKGFFISFNGMEYFYHENNFLCRVNIPIDIMYK